MFPALKVALPEFDANRTPDKLAERAWEDYKTRKALDYTRVLERRMNDRALLDIQEIKE